MRIKTEIFQGVFVATCDGTRLDASFAQVFFNSMRSAIEKGHTDIILDLSSVKFVDSTGLGAIVRCLKEINNRGHLVLCGVNESVLSLLKMTHLDAVFLRADTRATSFELLRIEKEKAEAELAAAANVSVKSFKGFDDSLLSSLSMEEGEPILEIDSKERRRHRRVGHGQVLNSDIIVYITHKGTSKRSAAIILNISASGILAVSPSKHSVGEKFIMEGHVGTHFKLEEDVIIRNCREGKYGFEFINPSKKTLEFLHQMVGSVVLDAKREKDDD
jgi:anti-sigma B factor antagonist